MSIVDPTNGNTSIVDASGQEVCRRAPKVTHARPFGSMVLVEHLTAKEILGTNLDIQEGTQVGSPQAYVLSLGAKVPEDSGLKVGDRVLLQGTYVPVPDYGDAKRERGLCEIHNIKAVLEEE